MKNQRLAEIIHHNRGKTAMETMDCIARENGGNYE